VEENHRRELEDFISPSDMLVLDIISSSIDAVRASVEMFRDRNCQQSIASLHFGTMAAFFCALYPELQNVDKVQLLHLCNAVHDTFVEFIEDNNSNNDEET